MRPTGSAPRSPRTRSSSSIRARRGVWHRGRGLDRRRAGRRQERRQPDRPGPQADRRRARRRDHRSALERAQALSTLTATPDKAPARFEALLAKAPKDGTLALYLGWAHAANGNSPDALKATIGRARRRRSRCSRCSGARASSCSPTKSRARARTSPRSSTWTRTTSRAGRPRGDAAGRAGAAEGIRSARDPRAQGHRRTAILAPSSRRGCCRRISRARAAGSMRRASATARPSRSTPRTSVA